MSLKIDELKNGTVISNDDTTAAASNDSNDVLFC